MGPGGVGSEGNTDNKASLYKFSTGFCDGGSHLDRGPVGGTCGKRFKSEIAANIWESENEQSPKTFNCI